MGQPVSAELPNITGRLYLAVANDSADGCFRAVGTASGGYPLGQAQSYNGFYKTFDASRSSSIYKDSATTVVPESLITNFYIKY